jgi:hypothetical protein
MRGKKMLQKLAMQDMQDVTELLNLADKCARAAEGRAWHSPPTSKVGKADKPSTGRVVVKTSHWSVHPPLQL